MYNPKPIIYRDPTFDALKFFAIFLVLWGHAIQYLVSTEYYDEPVYRIIYSFHMPLFMAIVGYFSSGSKSNNILSTLMKKFRQLLLPACIFGLIFLFLGCYKGGMKSGIGYWIYAFWFLKSAFGCFVLYFLSQRLIKQTFLFVIVSLVLSQFVFVFKINLMYPCFLFGVLLYNNFNFIKKHVTAIIPITGIIFLIMLLFWDERFWTFPTKTIRIGIQDIGYYGYTGYRIWIGLTGTLFFISLFTYLFSRIEISSNIKHICNWGQETLGIYLLQTFLLEMLLPKFLNFDEADFVSFNFVISPLISLVVLILCLKLINLIKKSSLLSFLLLGKKYEKRFQDLCRRTSRDGRVGHRP